MQGWREKYQKRVFFHKRFSMLGNLSPQQKKVRIVGAGINGLLIAYFLKRRGFKVELNEAADRAGGVIQTSVCTHGMIERAAHSLLVSAEISEFFKEIGVALVPVNPDSKARYIYRNKKMRRMPLDFCEVFQTLLHFFRRPKQALNFQSATLKDWGHAYLGEAATKYLLSPFITGIFACSPAELNAKLAFSKLVPPSPFLSLFRFFRSKPKTARPQMMTPLHGMQALVDRLSELLKNELHLNSPIQSLPAEENLILTLPTAAISKLLAKDDPASAQLLLQVRYAPLITVTCFYHQSAFLKIPKGVGVLIPRQEGLRMLGCLFNSSSFPGRTTSSEILSFTAMYGGTLDAEALSLSDDDLNNLLDIEMKTLLSCQSGPLSAHITRWNRAIPVYSNELKVARDALISGFCAVPGQIIFSNYSREVSIRSSIEALLHL